MALDVGFSIAGRYRIEQQLARGGMGIVFRALDEQNQRPVAVKVLRQDIGEDDAMLRFEREAQAASQIGDEHIVEVLEFGELDEGDTYMVMELLVGETLKQRLRRPGETLRTVLPLFIQLLNGLHAAHEAGIVHRDLKPDNVFIVDRPDDEEDFVKILDFGICKLYPGADGRKGRALTRTGAVLGTPNYMSPEQINAARFVDRRADVYAVGALLYRVCTGRPPHRADDMPELLSKITTEDPLPPESLNPQIDSGLSRLLLRALARNADDRFPTARALRDALVAWSRGEPFDHIGQIEDPPTEEMEPTVQVAPALPMAPPAALQRSIPPSGSIAPPRSAATVSVPAPPRMPKEHADKTGAPPLPPVVSTPIASNGPPAPPRRTLVILLGIAAGILVLAAAALISGVVP